MSDNKNPFDDWSINQLENAWDEIIADISEMDIQLAEAMFQVQMLRDKKIEYCREKEQVKIRMALLKKGKCPLPW